MNTVELLDHRFERLPGFDLATAWAARRQAFLASIPEHLVTVRVAPAAEPLLALLDALRGLSDHPGQPREGHAVDGHLEIGRHFVQPDLRIADQRP